MPDGRVPEPWSDFLRELDDELARLNLSETVDLHCFGGFVATARYRIERRTNDLDILAVRPKPYLRPLIQLAGEQSDLARKHRVYLDPQAQGIGTPPCEYEKRLAELYPGAFKKFRLLALEVHDLVLSKLEGNRDRDREDVAMLASLGLLDVETLKRRYDEELRPYLLAGTESRHDLTRDLWLEMIEEIRRGGGGRT